MSALLAIIFTLLATFTVSHYTLSAFWSNRLAIIAISAIFAVLCAIFLSLVGVALLEA